MNGRALGAWSLAALIIVLGGANPIVRALVALAALNLLITRAPSDRPLRPLLLGLALAGAFATLLNVLLAHAGRDVLVSVPDAIPLIGGPITLESAAFGVATGLGLVAAILSVAPLSLVLEPHELLDAFPAKLERSAIALATALNLVPAIRRSATGVIEAQRLRGNRPTGRTAWARMLVPIMLTTIDGSLQLAEAMEARAFASGPRSRYEPRRLDRTGWLTLASAASALGLYLVARIGGAAVDWQPYPSLTFPSLDPLVVAACLVLAVPGLPWLNARPTTPQIGAPVPEPETVVPSAPARNAADSPVLARLDYLSYAYPGQRSAALRDVSVIVEPGLTVLAGSSGSGKSTLLRVLDGLVPQFHGGTIAGAASLGRLDILRTPTRRLAREVGFVFQDPETQFVSGTVEREVAFGLENLGLDRVRMRARVGEALARLAIEGLRGRSVASLSGGERQRVALAAAIALRPRIVALDEPTAQLDPAGAAALIDACLALAAGGTAVIVAEHRLERLLPAADRLLLLVAGRLDGPAPAIAFADRLPAPPAVVLLGRRLGWSPLALEVASARARIPALGPVGRPRRCPPTQLAWSVHGLAAGPRRQAVVWDADLEAGRGEIIVLMGSNGGGKTTLLRTLAGLVPPLAGRLEQSPGRIAYLPQDPAALLHGPTVRAEVAATLTWAGSREPADWILGELDLLSLAERYPGDLSSGQRQRAAIAAVLAGSPAIALLDEPTRGMDGRARAALVALLVRARDEGASIVVATHDSDLAAEIGDRIVLVEAGRLIDLGSPEVALSGDVPWATQIGRLYPGGPVTVDGVMARLPRGGAGQDHDADREGELLTAGSADRARLLG